MGGSLGLRLKGLPDPPRVVGFGSREATLKAAFDRGAIDTYASDPAAAVGEADLVVLAAPVRSIPDLFSAIAPALKKSAIVTDVGSTKADITAEAEKRLPPHARFVGSHPMAGSEQSGIAAADAALYEQAVVVITPSRSSDESALTAVKNLWITTGAIPVTLDAVQHDRIVASISHLPHVVAAALVNTVAARAERDARTWDLAAGGFRDTTRIASSQSAIWRDICLANRDAILPVLDELRTELLAIRESIDRRDAERIERFFAQASTERERIPPKGRALLPSLFDLYVELPDRPAAIAEVTSVPGAAGINIVDIEIARVRETSAIAPLRLFFQSEEDREKARHALSAAGFGVESPR